MNSKNQLGIVTRKSPLALWQARYVQTLLMRRYPDLRTDILAIQTAGDRMLETPLATIGGKGLFIKELEALLLDKRADIAVHSMKDVAAELPPGLELSVILPRGDARDAFVCDSANSIQELPQEARVGTSSLRRKSQLLALRPDLQVPVLRGNVGTRLQRLDAGDYAAIILAMAGLQRLGLEHRATSALSPAEFLPAPGQGAIGIECRVDDMQTRELIAPLHDASTGACVLAERNFSQTLYGSCQLPIAGYASYQAEAILCLDGMVSSVDGKELLHSRIEGPAASAAELGKALGVELLNSGADRILQEILRTLQ